MLAPDKTKRTMGIVVVCVCLCACLLIEEGLGSRLPDLYRRVLRNTVLYSYLVLVNRSFARVDVAVAEGNGEWAREEMDWFGEEQ
jgi:hypothetical protein